MSATRETRADRFHVAVDRVRSVLGRPRVAMALTWVVQTSVILAILFYAGPNSPHGIITLGLSPERIIEIYGQGDAGSYLGAAQHLVDNGQITYEQQWVLNLWPPGMVWLDATIIAFSPLPFGVTIAIATALVWGTALALVTWPLIRRRRMLLVIALAELLILATPPFQSWVLDEGLFYADGFAAGTLLIGLAIIALRAMAGGPIRLWIRDGILAGVAIAAAVYFRSSNTFVPWAMFGLVVTLAVVVVVRRVRRIESGNALRHGILQGVALLTVLLLIAPYSALVLARQGRMQFTALDGAIYVAAWTPHDEFQGWLQQAGAGVGCDIDPQQCAEFAARDEPPLPDEARDALAKAILTHPGPWVVNRVSLVVRQWTRDDLGSYSYHATDYETETPNYNSSYNVNLPMGAAYLGLLLAACIVAVRLARRGEWSMLLIPLAALALLAPFSVVHVETRYLISIKILGLLAPFLVLHLRDLRTARRESEPAVAPGREGRRT